MSGRARRGQALMWVLLPFDLSVAAPAAYLLVLTGAAWRAHRRRRRPGDPAPMTPAPPTHRIVVLVPAHNEEQMIGATLDSLAGLDYPQHQHAVHVVADNCTDRTVEIARERGVHVFDRVDADNRGKGPALQWAIERLTEAGDRFDAVVVIDADSTMSAGFLRAIDARLTHGAVAVQGYYAVRDPESAPAVALRYAALALRHYLRPLGRTELGASSGLYGNGMAFRAEVSRAHAWTAHLTEDIELQMELLLAGHVIAYEPDAVVEAEMPSTLEAAASQNARWERGRLEMARRYIPLLLRRSLGGRGRGGAVACADAAMDLAVPPLSVLAAASVVATAASLATHARWRSGLSRTAAVLATGSSVALAAHVASGLRMVGAPPEVTRALLQAPQVVLWKLRLWVSSIVSPDRATWTRTRRNLEGVGDLEDTDPSTSAEAASR
jgi:cellulose synthase/poly-beta-1,6-N-acetylglucosamine synthase-like glycosyltransferase